MVNNPLLKKIFRYPVKSMRGEEVKSVEVLANGLVGDRTLALMDAKHNGICGAKQIPEVMHITASSSTEGILLTSPDGEVKLVSDNKIDAWLSQKLQRAVSLCPLSPREKVGGQQRHTVTNDNFRRGFSESGADPRDQVLKDLLKSTELEALPWNYFDAFPIMILTLQSLATMSNLEPDSQFDVMRFRPNLLIDDLSSNSPFPEQEWVGKVLCIGGLELKVTEPCPRCSMTTHAVGPLPRDTSMMRHLVLHADGKLGVYAKVISEGEIAINDRVILSPDRGP